MTFRQCLDIADVVIVVLSSDQTVTLINRKGCQILGLPEPEIVGKNWFDHFIPERQRESVRNVFDQIMTGEQEKLEHFENSVIVTGGEERTIAWRNSLLRDEKGRPVGILSSGEDVTSRRLTENALRDSEATLRAILETCVDGIITINGEGTILSFNPAAVRIFGYEAAEVIGRNVRVLMPEPVSSLHDRHLQTYLRSHEARIIGTGREVVGKRKNGTTFPLYLAVSEVSLSGKQIFTGVLRDLTDFKKMQGEIIQAQQLAAIGEMAASVAHEIKNPLAGISGAIEILKDTFYPGDSRRHVMDEILGEVHRLDSTVRDLLSFSRPWNPDVQLCNLQELVERVARTFKEQEENGHHLRYDFSETFSIHVKVDPWLFEKVLWNLLDNAKDAMRDSGEIRFSFDRTPEFLRMSVQDSGSGVPQEHMKDVFRPFFTTKSRGTGLGLAICRKIMDAHGGTISMHSEPGKGTRVTIQFPLSTAQRPDA